MTGGHVELKIRIPLRYSLNIPKSYPYVRNAATRNIHVIETWHPAIKAASANDEKTSKKGHYNNTMASTWRNRNV